MSEIPNAPNPFAGGFGPEVYEMYGQYLAQLQGEQSSSPARLGNKPITDSSGRLTNLSKASGLASDIDFAMQNRLLDYSAYDPITTSEIQDQRKRLRDLAEDQSNVSGFLANEILIGQSEIGAYNELYKFLETHAGEKKLEEGDEGYNASAAALAESIQASIPRAYNYDASLEPGWSEKAYDMSYVKDTIADFKKEYDSQLGTLSDDGTTYRLETTVDSPAQEALLKAGYVNTPGQAYDPWTLAPTGVTPESEQRIMDYAKLANENLRGLPTPGEDRRYSQSQSTNDGQPIPAAQRYDEGSYGAMSRELGRMRTSTPEERSVMSRSGDGSAPGQYEIRNGKRVWNPRPDTSFKDAERKAIMDLAESRRASASKVRSQGEIASREAIANALLGQGFSPFDDEVRRRNQAALGF